MLYRYTLFPLEKFLSILLSVLHELTGSYLLAIILLSIVVRLITTPLEKLAGKSAKKEHEISSVLAPQIAQIKEKFKGGERHEAIRRLYTRYSYHPIYAVRSMFGLLVQLPFFVAAFYMIGESAALQGVIVPFIGDLGRQDKLLFGTVSLLPFIMTGVNLLALFSTPDYNKKESIQGVCIALLFLILLYSSPAALLIYWTVNNLISLCKNLLFLKVKPGKGKTVAEKSQKVNLFIQKEFHYEQFIRLGAYLCFFFAIQEILYLIAMENWGTQVNSKLFAFAGMSLVLAIASSFVKRLNPKFLVLLFFCSCSVIFLAFSLPTEPHHIVNPNSLAVFFLLISSITAFKLRAEQNTFNIKEYFLITLLASITGFVFHWGSNSDYLFLETVSFYFLIAVSLPLVFCTVSFPFLLNTRQSIPLEGVGASCLLSFLFLPTMHEVLIWQSYLAEYILLLSISFPVITFLLYKKKQAVYVFFGIAILASSIPELFQVYEFQKNSVQARNLTEKRLEFLRQLPTDKLEMPNIYFLTSESTTDLATTEQLGIPTERFKKLLKKYDFKIYNSTYSLENASLTSVAATLNILKIKENTILTSVAAILRILKHNKTRDRAREVIGGHSFVNRWLQAIGYHTVSTQNNYMTGMYNNYDEFSGSLYPQKQIKLDFLKIILQGIGQREFKFDVGLNNNQKNFKKIIFSGRNKFEQYLEKVIKRDKVKPTFVIYHSRFPVHSQNSGICRENETEIYRESLTKGIAILEKQLSLIKKYDPDSIVVVQGDHGPYLRGDCRWLKNYKPDMVTELLLRDRFGTLVAIHWPDKYKASKYDKDLLINQDIFPVIFSYLYDSPEPLSLKVEPIVRYIGRELRNGKFH